LAGWLAGRETSLLQVLLPHHGQGPHPKANPAVHAPDAEYLLVRPVFAGLFKA
jgi:hypothetical protein